jgi:hypothetical protein
MENLKQLTQLKQLFNHTQSFNMALVLKDTKAASQAITTYIPENKLPQIHQSIKLLQGLHKETVLQWNRPQ